MGLHCEIFKPSFGDCSNNGLSSKAESVTLVEADGPFEADEKHPAVKLVTRHLSGRDYTHAEPVVEVPSDKCGYMFGGTYISTSDSRFPADYPIPLHDRTE